METYNSMIKLIKSTFYNEQKTKDALLQFIAQSDILSMGPKCYEAERMFSSVSETEYNVFFNSGSSANLGLVQSYLNLGMLRKGDAVAVSSLTWATNVMPLLQLGLHVIPVDVELSTINVSLSLLEKVVAKHDVKAFFITNALGFSDDLFAIADYCQQNGILFFEDNCESLGSRYKGKKFGTFGHASTSSFYVGHHLSTIEGGMVSTDDKALYVMLKMVRAHGWDRNLSLEEKQMVTNYESDSFYDRFKFHTTGYNLRPNELNGILLLQQLQYVDEIIEKRQSNFRRYEQALKHNPHVCELDTSDISTISNFACPVIFKSVDKFDQYRKLFEENYIEIRPVISGNITEHPFFRNYSAEKWDLPNCSQIHLAGFYFPNNPELTEEEIHRIVTLLETIL